MAKRKIYVDPKTSNELEFYLNDEGQLFLQCGVISNPDEHFYNGWICLDKGDVEDIITDLQYILSKM